MTGRDPWDAPVIPQCPDACPWRETCSSDTQAGIATLFREHRYHTPQDCTFYEHRNRVHFQTTGHAPPASVAELQAQLAARRAPEQEGHETR